MSRINLKTDYEDGQVLHGDELNVNNEVTQLGVNDNFDRITNMETNKANKSYVDSIVAEKADATTVNNAISTLNLTKADKSELATKADQADLDAKASISYVDSSVASKANKSYVDAQLVTKANTEDVETALEGKVNNAVVGDLNDLTTDDKTSIVNAINSIDVEASPIATTTTPGIVKPDGTTVTVDQDGTIHAAGGGGGGGTTDYALLSNKPQINSIELSGNKSLSDLGLMSANDINTSLGLKADKSTTYTKTQVDTAINTAVADKADASTVNAALEGKADKSTTYTKTAVDQLITSSEAGTDAKLLLKADADTTYNKNEVDSLVSAKADNMTFSNNVLQLKSGTTNIGNPVTIQVATNEIAIQDTEPSSADTKLWIDTSEDDDVTTIPSEVVDSLVGNENDKAPSVRSINEALVETYSTDEVKTNKVWIDGKPIYRKTIIYDSSTPLPNGSTVLAHNVENIGTYRNVAEYHFYYQGNMYAGYQSSSFSGEAISINNTNIEINIVGWGNLFTYADFTIEYTKTTD